MNIMLATALAAIATSAAPAPDHETVPVKWHVEVRDVPSDRASVALDPKSGRLVAAMDVDQNGSSVHKGESIPYVDPESVMFHTEADGSGNGSVKTLVLRTGLQVSVDGTAQAPVLHVKDVDLVEFYQQIAMGTYVTLPRTKERVLDTPVRLQQSAGVAGGYTMGDKGPAMVRFFVLTRI